MEIHRADSRGKVDHGWLKSAHSFSFSSYYDSKRMGFGALRVLNDDIVEPDFGFSKHGHENMEIISIPLSGTLSHKDSLGSLGTITTGEVQIMSAGTGIMHSEMNSSKSDRVNFLQIWILPKKKNIQPRYEQKFFKKEDRVNQFQVLVSPSSTDAVWINQDAEILQGDFSINEKGSYKLKNENSGVFVFLLEGKILINGETLNKRDAVLISESNEINFETLENSEILIIEVPMN